MSALSKEVQKLSPSSIIALFTLDTSNIGGGVYRFCSDKEADGRTIAFGGLEYPQISMTAEGFEWNSDGTMPRPKISVSALNETFYSLVVFTKGAQGALLQRDRTLIRFLDGHEDGGKNIKFPSDLYIVDRITQFTSEAVTMELLTPLDLPRCKLPARVALRDLCPWVYRSWNGSGFSYDQTGNACPYAGTKYFDRYGNICEASADSCGRTAADCVKRFGYRSLPFGGFCGLARNRA